MMRSRGTVLPALVLFAMLAVVMAADDRSDAFFDAVREGDLATVKRLHSEGVDVNVASRYGATALSFACDKGHLEVVRYLVKNGADVNVEDTFYNFNPIGWALFNDHDEIVKLLMASGSNGAADVLITGVRKKKVELIVLALDSGAIDAETMQQARQIASRLEDGEEVVALLESAEIESPPPPTELELPVDVLARYAGRYRDDDSGMVVEVKVDGKRLVATPAGQPSEMLMAIAEDRFANLSEGSNETITFSGRGGVIERAIVESRQGSMSFRRVEKTDAAATVDPSPRADKPAPKMIPVARGPARNWPSFRGEHASGIGDGQGIPLEWNADTGKNIAWKTAIPGLANSSPIVWGKRVFITTAVSGKGDDSFRPGLYGDVDSVDDLSEHRFRVYALDAKSGEVLWERTVASAPPGSRRHTKSTQANSTPVTDGKRVVALFGAIGLLVAHDLDGKHLWSTEIGALDSGWFYDKSYQWGHASSPVIYEDLVIVQADVQRDSFIAAYKLEDGSLAWKTERDEISTWGSPTVVRNGKKAELVTNGTTIRGYDPKTGKELWTLGPNSEVTVATPIAADGLVYVTAGYPPVRPIYAIRPGGRGDLTLEAGVESSAAVAWSKSRGGTYMPTPIVYRGNLYTCANNGRLTAYRSDSGEKVFQARVFGGGAFTASPVAADGRLYFSTEDGDVLVLRAGDEYEELTRNPMGEVMMSTPAMSDGLMVVRTLRHVYGIAEPADGAEADPKH